MNSYKLVKADDGIVWVSIQPLMYDVKNTLDKLQKVDTDKLNNFDKEVMDFNMIGLRAVYSFLDSLVQENKLNENTDRPTKH